MNAQTALPRTAACAALADACGTALALWRRIRGAWDGRWFPRAAFDLQVRIRLDSSGRTVLPLFSPPDQSG